VGDLTSPGGYKTNVVLIRDLSNNPIVFSGNPVYGLLRNTGTLLSPVWKLAFFAAGAVYSFATNTHVKLYGQFAYSLTTVPVVDPRFVTLAQSSIAL
jgi:hypothetical protein